MKLLRQWLRHVQVAALIILIVAINEISQVFLLTYYRTSRVVTSEIEVWEGAAHPT